MSCKSAISTVNTATVAGLANGSTLPLGSLSRKRGCQINLIGSEVFVKGEGLCEVLGQVTLVPNGTGVVTIQLYQDGVAVPGALGSATVASGNTATIPLVSMIRTADIGIGSKLSMVVTTNPTTVSVTTSNIAMTVKRI